MNSNDPFKIGEFAKHVLFRICKASAALQAIGDRTRAWVIYAVQLPHRLLKYSQCSLRCCAACAMTWFGAPWLRDMPSACQSQVSLAPHLHSCQKTWANAFLKLRTKANTVVLKFYQTAFEVARVQNAKPDSLTDSCQELVLKLSQSVFPLA